MLIMLGEGLPRLFEQIMLNKLKIHEIVDKIGGNNGKSSAF